jgi:hypothetical protein
MPGRNGSPTGEAFRQVNESIRELATDGPDIETWDFFCECADITCHSLVSLTLREYDERREAVPALPILGGNHSSGAA